LIRRNLKLENLFVRRKEHESQRQSCPHCGGKLNWANYPRKPRGVDKQAFRFSLCCSQDGCRRRQTPESIRFLGRKIYPALIVVLVSAMNHGLSQTRVAQLRKTLTVSRATLNRWRRWWRTHFVQTPFWKTARARFMPLVCELNLPGSLCERFGEDWAGRLRFAHVFRTNYHRFPGKQFVHPRVASTSRWP